MKIYSWGSTDVGMKRDHNEDSFLLSPEIGLYIVADGMGGHAGGEMASGISVRTVDRYIRDRRELVDPETEHNVPIEQSPVATLMSNAVKQACNAVYQVSQRVRELQGMGTTTIAQVFHRNYSFVGHVGDSRCYLVRDGRIIQLSEDHSLVNEQLRAGLITEAQAKNSKFKNIITRSVGFDTSVEVDIIAVETKAEDVFLMCSDGLSGLVTDEEMQDVITENFLYKIPDILIEMANSRGGDDNITIVLTCVVELDEAEFNDGSTEVTHVPGGAGFNAGII